MSSTNVVISSDGSVSVTSGSSTTVTISPSLPTTGSSVVQEVGSSELISAEANRATAAESLLAPLASPVFSGTPTAPTPSLSDSTAKLATTAFVHGVVGTLTGAGVSSFNTRNGAVTFQLSDLTSVLVGSASQNAITLGLGSAAGLAANTLATLASPAFTGSPTAPTPLNSDNSTAIATTAFVKSVTGSAVAGVSSFNTRTGAITLAASDLTTALTGNTASQNATALGLGTAAAVAANTLATLASPAFTGTPTAPTPLTSDSSTAIATTAFVKAVTGSAVAGVSSFNTRTGAVTLAASDLTTALTGNTAAQNATALGLGSAAGLASSAFDPAGAAATAVTGLAPLASPVFTGNPTAPTQISSDNSTKLATTAFVQSVLSSGTFTTGSAVAGVSSFNTRTGAITLAASDITSALSSNTASQNATALGLATGAAQVAVAYATVGQTTVSAPYIIKASAFIQPPRDGSNFGAQINAFLTDAVNHNYTRAEIGEGWVTAETPILMKNGLHVIGPKRMNENLTNWDGGLQIDQPIGGGDVIQAIGTNADGGASLTGFLQGWGLERVKLVARQSATTALAGAPSTLLNVVDGYRIGLYDISFSGAWTRHLLLKVVWDSDMESIRSSFGGYSDCVIKPNNATTGELNTLHTYTGRSSLIAGESNLNISYGVPTFELFSPNTTGYDSTNNCRFRNFHIESNPNNGVQILCYGGNSVKNSFMNGKIEAIESNVPLIVFDNQIANTVDDVWLFGAAFNSSTQAVGKMASGYAYKSQTTLGLFLAYQSSGCELNLRGGWNGSQGGPIESFVFMTNCDDMAVEMSITDGLSKIENDQYGGAILLSGCTRPRRLSAKAPSYVTPASPAAQEICVLNSTNLGSGYMGPFRKITGTTSTDTAKFDDRGGTIYSTGTVGVTATINDIGAGVTYEYVQGSSLGVVTVAAGTNVTLVPSGHPTATSGIGTRLLIKCNGDGTASVRS